MSLSPPLHPAVEPIAFLLGTWKGEGEGGYPTIQAFQYGEEVKFGHSGKPVIAYSQKTWKLSSGEPMHAESGFWRPKPDGTIEVVISQSTGIAEVQKGRYDSKSQTIEVKSSLVGNASKVQTIHRKFYVEDNSLSYSVGMETVTQALHPHLKAKLIKSSI